VSCPARVHLLPDEKRRPLSQPAHVSTWGRHGLPSSSGHHSTSRKQALKRAADILGAAAGFDLAVASDLDDRDFCSSSIRKVRFCSPKSVNGFNGRSFRIFKFRTMTVTEDGPIIQQATRDDPRVTRLGRWFAPSQTLTSCRSCFNVLKGEMSLVGPRPHATAHNTKYEQENRRLRVSATTSSRELPAGRRLMVFRGETRNVVHSWKSESSLIFGILNNWSIWIDLQIFAEKR